jgi:Uma2 family endonuclease
MSSNLSPLIRPGKIVLTYDDYCALPNDLNRYEILDGELSVTPVPATKHQIASGNLHRILSNYVLATRIGRLLLSPIDLILATTTVVQPDLIFIGSDRSHVVTQRGVEGAPTLVVEILSPTTHATDRQTKAQLYAKYAVPHYWLIDPDQQTLQAYTLTGTQYSLITQVQGGDLFTSALFPGLSFQISDLWV